MGNTSPHDVVNKIPPKSCKPAFPKPFFLVYFLFSMQKTNQNPGVFFEEELSSDLEKDDVVVIARRYESYRKRIRQVENKLLNDKISSSSSSSSSLYRTQTQWTRSLDAVQEHFSSHVVVDGTSHKLPPLIYALKLDAKHSWLLYKKRECERRKRIRKKLEEEKKKERDRKEPANILLSMVDMCEICKRLYVTVNLFWGVTICDSCYFNPCVINDIMKAKHSVAESKIEITPENVVEEITRRFGIPFEQQQPPSSELSTTPEKSTKTTTTSGEDFRTFSTYVSPSDLNSPSRSPGNPMERYEILEDLNADDLFLFDGEEERAGFSNWSQHNNYNEENTSSSYLPIPYSTNFSQFYTLSNKE